MDEADKGNETADKTLQTYINRIRKRAETSLIPTGFCFNCEEVIRGRLFCDTECRDDYEKRNDAHNRRTP
jgi:hypothetical protein